MHVYRKLFIIRRVCLRYCFIDAHLSRARISVHYCSEWVSEWIKWCLTFTWCALIPVQDLYGCAQLEVGRQVKANHHWLCSTYAKPGWGIDSNLIIMSWWSILLLLMLTCLVWSTRHSPIYHVRPNIGHCCSAVLQWCYTILVQDDYDDDYCYYKCIWLLWRCYWLQMQTFSEQSHYRVHCCYCTALTWLSDLALLLSYQMYELRCKYCVHI